MKQTQTRGIRPLLPTPQKGARKSQGISKSAYLKRPELGLMDRLLRSFKGVAHEDWIPGPYLNLIKQRRKSGKYLH